MKKKIKGAGEVAGVGGTFLQVNGEARK